MTTTIDCQRCLAEISDHTAPVDHTDSEAWATICAQHWSDCEWVASVIFEQKCSAQQIAAARE